MRRRIVAALQYAAIIIVVMGCMLALPLWWLGEKIEGRNT